MSIEATISPRSRGATSSGTTAAESCLPFVSKTAWPEAVSRACFERAECGFLRSAKTKRAKSMWWITEEGSIVSLLLPHRLVVSRRAARDWREFEVFGTLNVGSRISCLSRASRSVGLSDWFRSLLQFSCQPINRHPGHFRHDFPGVL